MFNFKTLRVDIDWVFKTKEQANVFARDFISLRNKVYGAIQFALVLSCIALGLLFLEKRIGPAGPLSFADLMAYFFYLFAVVGFALACFHIVKDKRSSLIHVNEHRTGYESGYLAKLKIECMAARKALTDAVSTAKLVTVVLFWMCVYFFVFSDFPVELSVEEASMKWASIICALLLLLLSNTVMFFASWYVSAKAKKENQARSVALVEGE